LPGTDALFFITSLRGVAGEIDQYVHEHYSIAKFKATYAKNVPSIEAKHQWEVVNPGFVLNALVQTRAPGRPRKTRIRSSAEGSGLGPRKRKCKRCGGLGHIARNCKNAVDPSSRENQPLEPQWPLDTTFGEDQPLEPQVPLDTTFEDDQSLEPQVPLDLAFVEEHPLELQVPSSAASMVPSSMVHSFVASVVPSSVVSSSATYVVPSSAASVVSSSAASTVPSSAGLAMVEPSNLALVLPSIAASSKLYSTKIHFIFQDSKIQMIIYYFHVLCRENKRKRGKGSPTKNTTTKVMKKTKIKKRLVVDL
jgi:hypothetical protein